MATAMQSARMNVLQTLLNACPKDIPEIVLPGQTRCVTKRHGQHSDQVNQ
jgi:hypothetical protein